MRQNNKTVGTSSDYPSFENHFLKEEFHQVRDVIQSIDQMFNDQTQTKPYTYLVQQDHLHNLRSMYRDLK